MEKIKVTIQGITPLLFNRFRDIAIEGKSKKRTGAMADSDIEDKLYLDENGKPQLPAVYLRNAMIEGAKQFKIVGKGKSTYSKLVGSSVDVFPEMINLDAGKYEVFRISGINPTTRGRVMISRPRYNKWKASFEIILNDKGVPIEVVNEILEHSGRYVGVGDWRPALKGTHGKFQIIKWEVV
ncbi:MAG: hypothetical protein ACHQ1D_01050 [Nitrososphaerales archaeon]